MISQVAHIGIVVRDMEKARELYKSVFNLTPEPVEKREEFTASMIKVGDVCLELLSPTGDKGAVAKFLEKRGEGIHHICLEVDDIEATLKLLSADGIELVDKVPRQGIEGKVAFLHPSSTSGTLIELVEKP